MISPTSGSAALIAATAAICSRLSTGRDCFLISATIASTRLLDAALDAHRVGPGADVLEALGDDRLAEDDGGRRAVAGDVVGLGRDLLEKLRAHVLERVVELDVARDGHTVVGDRGRAELLVEHDVTALRPERDADGVGETVDAALEAPPRHLIEEELLGHGVRCPFRVCGGLADIGGTCRSRASTYGRLSTIARMSFWLTMRRSSPSILNSVPAYLA